MEGAQFSNETTTWADRNSWNRLEAAHRLQWAEQFHQSQRESAAAVGVPRSTLGDWQRRKENLGLPGGMAAFFESPEGTEFLHRLLVALHVIFGVLYPGGVRLITEFLRLTQLDRVISPSYGAQLRYRTAAESALEEFGREEKARLAEGMPQRDISICEDETFHPQICLVAIEPVSGFIVLEEYVSNRESECWDERLKQALEGFQVDVIQSTSDQGPSLLKHCRVGLDAHHSPDVFHVQQDVSRAFSGKTNGAVKREKTKLREAGRETARLEAERRAAGATHEAFFAKQIELAKLGEEKIARDVEKVKQERQIVRDAVRGISGVYHPVDLQTGQTRSAEDVEAKLTKQFDDLEKLADTWDVPKSGRKLIAKARNVLSEMTATIAFFWLVVHRKLDALELPAETKQQLIDQLLPAEYLRLVGGRASKAEERKRLRGLSETLFAKARDGPLRNLSEQTRQTVESVVRECAGVFQRSSSCVEGRNGRLALHHHGTHRLSDRKLAALTTLHNYFIKRTDQTTAAERFFGRPPHDLFEWLLDRLPLPPRPRRRRATLISNN